MRHLLFLSVLVAAVSFLMAGCDDNSDIGSSLVSDEIEIIIDSTFTVTGQSVDNKVVQSRTITQLLGLLDAKGYGRLRSDIVTAFMPAAAIDLEGGVTGQSVDSVKLIMDMYSNAMTGDSLVPMGVTVYQLTSKLAQPIYSDFDPDGKYDPTPIGFTTYAPTNLGQGDSMLNLAGRSIYVDLPKEIGAKFIDAYINTPAVFTTPQSFAEFFPGLYIKSSFGSGRIVRIARTTINVYYHVNTVSPTTGNDTIIGKSGIYMAVTPEIVTNNIISYNIASDLRRRADAGEALIVAPTGLDVEMKFPGQEILNFYNDNAGSLAVVNDLTFELPARNISNDYSIAPPAAILMIKKKDREKFFANNSVPDNVSSFYAMYNAESGSYVFSSLRGYFMDLLDKGEASAEDTEFIITPIQVVTEDGGGYNTTSYVSNIVPYISNPAMAQLMLDRAKIKFTFSKQVVNF